jgi:hypothetical protein
MTAEEIEASVREIVAAERVNMLTAVNEVLSERLLKLEEQAAAMQETLREMREHERQRPSLRIVN